MFSENSLKLIAFLLNKTSISPLQEDSVELCQALRVLAKELQVALKQSGVSSNVNGSSNGKMPGSEVETGTKVDAGL